MILRALNFLKVCVISIFLFFYADFVNADSIVNRMSEKTFTHIINGWVESAVSIYHAGVNIAILNHNALPDIKESYIVKDACATAANNVFSSLTGLDTWETTIERYIVKTTYLLCVLSYYKKWHYSDEWTKKRMVSDIIKITCKNFNKFCNLTGKDLGYWDKPANSLKSNKMKTNTKNSVRKFFIYFKNGSCKKFDDIKISGNTVKVYIHLDTGNISINYSKNDIMLIFENNHKIYFENEKLSTEDKENILHKCGIKNK